MSATNNAAPKPAPPVMSRAERVAFGNSAFASLRADFRREDEARANIRAGRPAAALPVNWAKVARDACLRMEEECARNNARAAALAEAPPVAEDEAPTPLFGRRARLAPA